MHSLMYVIGGSTVHEFMATLMLVQWMSSPEAIQTWLLSKTVVKISCSTGDLAIFKVESC